MYWSLGDSHPEEPPWKARNVNFSMYALLSKSTDQSTCVLLLTSLPLKRTV